MTLKDFTALANVLCVPRVPAFVFFVNPTISRSKGSQRTGRETHKAHKLSFRILTADIVSISLLKQPGILHLEVIFSPGNRR